MQLILALLLFSGGAARLSPPAVGSALLASVAFPLQRPAAVPSAWSQPQPRKSAFGGNQPVHPVSKHRDFTQQIASACNPHHPSPENPTWLLALLGLAAGGLAARRVEKRRS